jgi:hypothetical protein
MLEVINILTLWLFFAWVVFFAPLWTSGSFGFWAGVVMLVIYTLTTVVYFVLT